MIGVLHMQQENRERNLSRDDPVVIEFIQRFAAIETKLAVLETELKYLKSDVKLIKYLLFAYIASTVIAMLLLRVVS
jgi:predicted RNA methylase